MSLLPYSLARPCHADDVPRWDIETDVAVIGFGAAGSCAAIEARQAGAQVHVFEVAAAPGGSAWWSRLSSEDFTIASGVFSSCDSFDASVRR